jgi:hypothetical protein
MERHPQVDHTTCGVLDDEEGEHGTEAEVGAVEEVTRPDPLGLAAQEGGPGLPAQARSPRTSQVLLNGPFSGASGK